MHRPSLFSNSHPLAFSSPAIAVLPSLRCCYKKQKLTTVHAEEPKVTREYREDDDSVVSASTSQPVEKNPNSKYIDEMPEIPRTEMSDSMKKKLQKEYYNLGGSPGQAMGANWFLYIILIISLLALLSAALGYI